MEVSIDTTTRAVQAIGTSIAALDNGVLESISDQVAAAIMALLPTLVGDAYVSLAPDLQTTAVVGPSPSWTAAHTTQVARSTIVNQHLAALQTLLPALTANSAQMSADLTALATIAGALSAGTTPTAAQQVIIDRVLVRMVVVLAQRL